MARWRVGRTLGRTLYLDDQCVGMVDTIGVASEIVETMNATNEEDARKLWGMHWAEVHRERQYRDKLLAENEQLRRAATNLLNRTSGDPNLCPEWEQLSDLVNR